MNDVYARITDRIVAELEKGLRPWLQSWSGGLFRPLRATGEPYRGVNTVLLWCEGARRGFKSPTWMTFRQAVALGSHVRFGETGTLVVYANRLVRAVENEAGEETEEVIPFLKGYVVFNCEQIAGLPHRFYSTPEKERSPVERIDRAEHFLVGTGAVITDGPQPCYIPALDEIRMPPIERFDDAEGFYATAAHELLHWTAHSSRLNRDFGRRWGDESYGFEELVAELGAAFLAADLELSAVPRADHASYLAGWLAVLRKDKRSIFTAASQAQRAVDYLHSLADPDRRADGAVNQAGTRNEQKSLALSRDSQELQSAAPQQEYA